MSIWKDYNLENPSTWTVMQAPPLDREWLKELRRIGGLNPHGKPVLMVRWGATYRDPMSTDHGLKYWLMTKDPELAYFEFTDPVTGMTLQVRHLKDVPSAVLVPIPKYTTVKLGERRWIVEIWRSAEFLARSGRYQSDSTVDNGISQDFVFCRNCHTEIPHEDQSVEPPPCPECRSVRYYIKTEREAGEGKLLHTNPAEGAYDFFCRLESVEGEPLDADANTLEQVRMLWQATKKTSKKKLADMLAETEQQAMTQMRATSPTNPFQRPAVR